MSGVAFAGQPSRQDLQKVEAQLQAERHAQEESERKAKELKKEVSSVQGQLVSTARQIQTQEGRISLM
ncbi:MAG: hypothetical protein MJ041_05540, partial [Acidaminococcaceae bacterium]|nr:hypothetical protein [Acidaminococcaceae bacterium]